LKVKLRISRRDQQYVVAFAITITVIYSGIAYAGLTPPRPDSFFATWVLGANGKMSDYYPNGKSNITVGEGVRWTIGVYNHMGSLQYAVIRVKLLNSTLDSPNQTTATPSPVTPILEFARILTDNETWSIPFVWQVLNATQKGDNVAITRLSMNNNTLSGELVSSVEGRNLRFVFELWFYDEATHELTFSWVSAEGRHSAWTEIWFNATMVS
jgi:uncharacterized membrane protein